MKKDFITAKNRLDSFKRKNVLKDFVFSATIILLVYIYLMELTSIGVG